VLLVGPWAGLLVSSGSAAASQRKGTEAKGARHVIRGGPGNDVLRAPPGNAVIFGGRGNDRSDRSEQARSNNNDKEMIELNAA
jgi:hypothetical protein